MPLTERWWQAIALDDSGRHLTLRSVPGDRPMIDTSSALSLPTKDVNRLRQFQFIERRVPFPLTILIRHAPEIPALDEEEFLRKGRLARPILCGTD